MSSPPSRDLLTPMATPCLTFPSPLTPARVCTIAALAPRRHARLARVTPVLTPKEQLLQHLQKEQLLQPSALLHKSSYCSTSIQTYERQHLPYR